MSFIFVTCKKVSITMIFRVRGAAMTDMGPRMVRIVVGDKVSHMRVRTTAVSSSQEKADIRFGSYQTRPRLDNLIC